MERHTFVHSDSRARWIASRIARAALVAAVATTLLACGNGDPARERDSSAAAPDGAASAGPPRAPTADGSLAATSAGGRFRIAIRPETGRASIGALHAWIVEVTLPDGRATNVIQLRFDGGMPQHGHGFETTPRVTDRLGPAAFRVDGVRFQMAGNWKLRVDVAAEGAADFAEFDYVVGP